MLVFLDIDGVMVLAKAGKCPELLNDGFPAFSNRATHALQLLLTRGEVTIMLTTSHKANYSIEKWKEIFKNRGIEIQNLKSLPANVDNLSRKTEIVNWVNINDMEEDFIIIDDDKSLNDLPVGLKEHLVLTSPYIGLTETHLEEINSIRNRRLQPA